MLWLVIHPLGPLVSVGVYDGTCVPAVGHLHLYPLPMMPQILDTLSTVLNIVTWPSGIVSLVFYVFRNAPPPTGPGGC